MSQHQNARIQLDGRAQASLNAMAGLALDPAVIRSNCLTAIIIASAFIALIFGAALFVSIVMVIQAGAAGAVASVIFLGLAAVFSAIPLIIILRTRKVMRALPR